MLILSLWFGKAARKEYLRTTYKSFSCLAYAPLLVTTSRFYSMPFSWCRKLPAKFNSVVPYCKTPKQVLIPTVRWWEDDYCTVKQNSKPEPQFECSTVSRSHSVPQRYVKWTLLIELWLLYTIKMELSTEYRGIYKFFWNLSQGTIWYPEQIENSNYHYW